MRIRVAAHLHCVLRTCLWELHPDEGWVLGDPKHGFLFREEPHLQLSLILVEVIHDTIWGRKR